MIWINKNKTFAIRTEDMTGSDGNGIMIQFLPCINIFINGENNDKTVCLGLTWFCWAIQFWFGNDLDLAK